MRQKSFDDKYDAYVNNEDLSIQLNCVYQSTLYHVSHFLIEPTKEQHHQFDTLNTQSQLTTTTTKKELNLLF